MSDRLELKVTFLAIDKFLPQVKAITAGASAAAKAMKENRERVDELNGSLSKIDAYKRVEKEAAIAANSFKANERRIAELREELGKLPKDVSAVSTTWKQFTAQRMAEYMRTEGSHSAAMKRMSAEWKTLKETGGAAAGDVAKKTAELTRELEKLKKKSEDLTDKSERLRVQEINLRGALVHAKIDTSNLAAARQSLAAASSDATMNSHRLQAALDAENAKMRRLRAAQADVAAAREKAGKWAGFGAKAMAGGAAINAAAAVPVMAYAKAEDAATQLRIAMMQKGGVVPDLFGEINSLAERLGNKLPGTTADYQEMMTMLVRQGMPAKNILGGLGEATAYLAVQLKMAPTAAAEFASRLQDATRTADKDMMGLMDTIQKTFYLGVDQNNMLQGFAKLSPALSIIKKEGADAARALAPLLVLTDQAGMQGEAAGNAFRKIFQMSLDTKKLGKGNAALAGTGIKLDFSDGKGEFGGLDKMYAQLERLRTVNTQKRLAALKAIFGDDAETLQALTIMIERGVTGYKEVQAKMEAQADIQRRVNEQLGTLKSLWDAASGTFTNALVTFGESISPELHASAEWLAKVAERTQAWAKENPQLSGALMTTVKWLGLAAIGIGGLAVAVGGIVVPMAIMKYSLVTLGVSGTSSMGLLSMAIRGVGIALKATGIGLALTALITMGVLIYENWDKVKNLFATMFDGILEKINRLKANLRYLMPSLFGDLKDTPTRATTTATLTASPIVKQLAGSTYNISVAAQPGADNNDLARKIRDEMERMDREKAAKRRGSLRDME